MSTAGTPEHEDSCYGTVLKDAQVEISEAFAGPLAPVPGQDLGDAAIGHLQDARDVAGPGA